MFRTFAAVHTVVPFFVLNIVLPRVENDEIIYRSMLLGPKGYGVVETVHTSDNLVQNVTYVTFFGQVGGETSCCCCCCCCLHIKISFQKNVIRGRRLKPLLPTRYTFLVERVQNLGKKEKADTAKTTQQLNGVKEQKGIPKKQ